MGYQFDNLTQTISYGTHTELYQAQDMSVGFWIKFLPGISDNKTFLGQLDAFPIVLCNVRATIADGLGVVVEHVKGGSFSFGVNCIPGQIDPIFELNINTWMYFGISREFGTRTYFSYFGSRTALVDGQTATWLPGEEPYPISQPGQILGPWVVGSQIAHAIVGPASYWDVPLTREQHLSMARCTLPTGVDPVHLLWWTKMFEGAADVSTNLWTNTFSGTPLPLYVPDEGCASFNNDLHYRLYNTG